MDKLMVRNARLERKIEKLKKAKAFHEEKHKHYAKVIEMQPFIVDRWERYEDKVRHHNHVKDLERRVKEQELFIRLLTNQSVGNWEIDLAYQNMLKEERKKREMK